jgi:hypothetical protein
MNSEFQDVLKVFKEEPLIGELLQSYSQEYIESGLHCSVTNNNENNVKLQFCGWELVLLPDGTYYINDTSGG